MGPERPSRKERGGDQNSSLSVAPAEQCIRFQVIIGRIMGWLEECDRTREGRAEDCARKNGVKCAAPHAGF